MIHSLSRLARLLSKEQSAAKHKRRRTHPPDDVPSEHSRTRHGHVVGHRHDLALACVCACAPSLLLLLLLLEEQRRPRRRCARAIAVVDPCEAHDAELEPERHARRTDPAVRLRTCTDETGRERQQQRCELGERLGDLWLRCAASAYKSTLLINSMHEIKRAMRLQQHRASSMM